MIKRKSTTPVAAQPTTPTFDPSTWSNQPRLLAGNQAEAAAIEAAALSAGIILVLTLIAWFVADAKPVEAISVAAVALAVGICATFARWSYVYSNALRADTEAVRQATWLREVVEQRDLDGDNVIGDPFRTVPVKREGKATENVIYDLPSNSERGAPVMQGWGVSQADLISFLFEAERGRGLQERAWVGEKTARHVLPSGGVVTQALFRQIVQALADHGMAIKQANRWELDVRAEDVATALKP